MSHFRLLFPVLLRPWKSFPALLCDWLESLLFASLVPSFLGKSRASVGAIQAECCFVHIVGKSSVD